MIRGDIISNMSKGLPIKGFIKQFRYIFSKKQKRYMVFIVFVLFVGALIETGATALMLLFMNALMKPDTIANSRWRILLYDFFNCGSTNDLLVLLAAAMAVLYVFKGLYGVFLNRIVAGFTAKNRSSISAKLFDCYIKKSYDFHTHKNSSEVIRTVVTDTNQLFQMVSDAANAIAEVLVVICLLIFLFLTNIKLTLIALTLIIGTLLIVNFIVVKRVRAAGERTRDANIAMMRTVYQSMGGLKCIKVGGREQYFINEYAQNASANATEVYKFTTLSAVPRIVVEMVSMGGIFSLVAILASSGTNVNDLLPLFATFALAAVRIMPAANRINNYYNGIVYKYPAMQKIYDALFESGVNMNDGADVIRPVSHVMHNEPLSHGIEVNEITFAFSDSDEPLFSNASLFIPARKSTAFVGTTGSGKTTMADIILGLREPEAGCVIADGHDIHIESEWWSQRVGYIPQEIYLTDDSIRMNVAFGFDPGGIDDEWVWRCLDDAALKDFVQSLPKGLDTVVGEKGVRLSGGQRQRVGIARALYTAPQVLVLDEATSSLDNDTERAIVESINRLSSEKTMLIIAHRLSTIKDCDLIYRIENGTITRER